jgi:alcohol dehydrogenase
MPPGNPATRIEAFRSEVPTRLHFAWDAIRDVAWTCSPLGSRVLVVTGRQAMERLGVVQRLCTDLEAAGISYAQFADLHAGPTTDDIDRGAAVCREFQADFIIALGGGNVIDGAKVIAAVSVSTGCAADFLYGRENPGNNTLPLVAIPTTSGTGSELNRSAIITDPQRAHRDGVRSEHLFPRAAIVDPKLTCSLDRIQTSITGFDCLSHAIESYVSPKARGDTDQLARHAMRLVCRYLPVALANPDDREARTGLAVASTTMGVNLSCVGTCYPHRVDKALCALHPTIPHGQSVAIFYPHWIARSWPGSPEKFADIAEILAPATAALPSDRRAENLSSIIFAFLKRLDLDRSLSDFGVTRDQIPELAERVRGDLSVNPVPVSRHELPDLLLQDLEPSEALP